MVFHCFCRMKYFNGQSVSLEIDECSRQPTGSRSLLKFMNNLNLNTYMHVQDASVDRPSSCATESDVHGPQRSASDSAAHSAGHSATTVDSLVYGVRPEDTGKVVKVLQHVTGTLRMGSIASMLYNVARSAENSYQDACRCSNALLILVCICHISR